ncbi:MAG: hypothetical protein ACPIOQ_64280, partial [Promethearchaeia archaeon]
KFRYLRYAARTAITKTYACFALAGLAGCLRGAPVPPFFLGITTSALLLRHTLSLQHYACRAKKIASGTSTIPRLAP